MSFHVSLESMTLAGTGDAWLFHEVQGTTPDPNDVVQLADGWTYSWAWANGVVPGQLEPATASASMLCRTSDDVPLVDVGHLLNLRVWLAVHSGPIVIIDKVLRVTSVTVELTPPDADDPFPYSAVVALELTDLLADLTQTTITNPLGIPAHTYGGVGYGYQEKARSWWRPRLAEVAVLGGFSLGNPTWWNLVEQPPARTDNGTPSSIGYNGLTLIYPSLGGFGGQSPLAILTELLNSHQPAAAGTALTHCVVPFYGASWPTDYEFVGGLPPGSEYGAGDTVPADLNTVSRFMLVPASRRSIGHTSLTLDAAWCHVPATARRSREHIVNNVRVGGVALIADPADPLLRFIHTADKVDVMDTVDAGANGVSTRELPTQLQLYASPNSIPTTFAYPAVATAATRFLSVTSARNAGYTYDTFVVDGSLIEESTQVGIFPFIAPRGPDEEDGDGYQLRHVTIDNLDPAVGFGSTSVSGFVRAGTLTVADGALRWTLRLTPGDPT